MYVCVVGICLKACDLFSNIECNYNNYNNVYIEDQDGKCLNYLLPLVYLSKSSTKPTYIRIRHHVNIMGTLVTHTQAHLTGFPYKSRLNIKINKLMGKNLNGKKH